MQRIKQLHEFMDPFFSIVLPTFNRAHLVSKAIDSVIAQNFSAWELIIIDDGSTDSTKTIIQAYTDRRIKYLYQENAERSAARNNGIANSRGAYICFLDSDDYYLPPRLDHLYKQLEKLKFPITAFYTGLIFEQSGVRIIKEVDLSSENIFEHIILSSIHSQQICIHRSILAEFHYDTQFRIGEDTELWLRIAKKFPFTYIKNQPDVVVVQHANRSVNVKRYNFYLENLQLFNYVFQDGHSGNKISSEIKAKVFGNCYYGIAKHYIYNQKRILASFYLAKSILSNPNATLLRFRINVLLQLIIFSPISSIESLIE